MSLATYASRVTGLIDELGQGWPEEDLRTATEAMHAMGLARWEEWRADRADAVHALLAATPVRRAALLRRSDEPVLLKVAAMQALAEAAALLRTAADLESALGLSYRQMAAGAATSFRALLDSEPAYDPGQLGRDWWGHPWVQALAALLEQPSPAAEGRGARDSSIGPRGREDS